jgi:hypothetical protein
MATKVVDARGKPFDTIERRRRMGFMGGDLIIDHDTASSVTPPERTYTVEPTSESPPLPDKIHAFGRSS